MTRDETAKFFDYMSEFFPRMSGSAQVIEMWHKKFQRYPYGLMKRAFERFCEGSDKAPTLAAMMGCISSVAGPQARAATITTETPTHTKVGAADPAPKTKLDIAMDALGAKFVTDAIAEIVGAPGTFKWSDLTSRKDWVPVYRAKVEELYQLARNYHNALRCEDGSDPLPDAVPHFQEREP
jgi:hypothetical protein